MFSFPFHSAERRKMYKSIFPLALCLVIQTMVQGSKMPFTGSLKNMGRACESKHGDGVCAPVCGRGTFDGGVNSYCGKNLYCCVIDYRPGTGERCGYHGSYFKHCAAKPYCKDERKTNLAICASNTHCCAKLPEMGEKCDRGHGMVGKCKAKENCKGGVKTSTCSGSLYCCQDDSIDKIEWTYKGPFGQSNWVKNFPDCGGRKQTPINIDSSKTMVMDSDIMFNNYDTMPADGYVIGNNGHTAQMGAASIANGPSITLGNGITYNFLQLHFHWGSNDKVGSEHSIDGDFFPMELHLVHVNPMETDPLAVSNGLAVLGIMFEIGDENEDFEPIIKSLKKIKHEDSSTDVDTFPLSALLPTKKSIYRYKGSLTTPPCSEAVVWSVFQKPVKISKHQLAEFRTLIDNFGKKMVDNFRSLQHLLGREVSFKHDNRKK